MRSLIKYHFTLLFIHLIITSCIFLTKVLYLYDLQYDNINRANVPSSSYQSAVSYVNNYLIVSVVMLGVQLLVASIGFTYTRVFFALRITFIISRVNTSDCWNFHICLFYTHENALFYYCLYVGCILSYSFFIRRIVNSYFISQK